MNFPVGTRFNRWSLHLETQKGSRIYVIRRWAILPNGQKKIERLPVLKYKAIRDNEIELKSFLVRINEQSKELRTKEAVIIKHAFITPQMLDAYKEYLLTQIPTRSKAIAEFNYLTKYFLNYFIGKLNLADPIQWHKIHDSKWADYLIGPDTPKAVDTKKIIIYAANRFMGWLHKQRPTEVPPLRFKPLTKAKFKQLEAIRIMNGESRVPKIVIDEDWAVMKLRVPDFLRPFMMIAYLYGLRRAETLGLKLEDVKKGHLYVQRQLDSIPDNKPNFVPVKGRVARKVPHWFGNPQDCHKLISYINDNLMHPDTLTDLWAEFMSSLRLDYTFHDLRHTWTTKAIRQQKVPRDVQLAAGHKNIETTMSYLHDDRDLDDEQFVPEVS